MWWFDMKKEKLFILATAAMAATCALAGHDGAPGLRLEKRGGKIGDGMLRICLLLAPAASVQPVKLYVLALDPHIAGQQMRMGDRHVELGAIGVLNREDLAARIADHHFRRAEKPPDAEGVIRR